MSGHIFNIQEDGNLVEMNEEPFENEDIFQTLLQEYPNLLAGDQINSGDPRRWLLIRREMGIPAEEFGSDRWSLDHLFLDQDAIPTLVEVKRSSDTRIRREVVGQMFDYAANAVVHWSIDQITSEYERQCDDDGVESTQRLEEFLRDGREADEFWQSVKTNLQAGKIRMLFVADKIPPELRRIVEFLNVQMDPAEVLAVEIKHFVGTGLKTLVPRIIGQTARTETPTGKKAPPLSEEELQQIANERGIGEPYSSLVSQLKPLFGNISTTRSNVAFKGKVTGYRSLVVLVSLGPVYTGQERGVMFRLYIDRLAEFFTVDKQELIDLLPPWDNIEDTGDWAGDIYTGYVKKAAALNPALERIRKAKRDN